MHTPPALRRRSALLLLSSLTILGSCVDGPFARVNPNDDGMQFEMTLVSSRDTVSPANPVVVFQVITTPAISGYETQWEGGGGLVDRGNGVYEMTTPPNALAPSTVTAKFLTRSVSRVIYRAPTP